MARLRTHNPPSVLAPAEGPPRAARGTRGGGRTEPRDERGERIDTSYLESLLGYNARRAALAVIEVFLERMAPYGLKPVDFSVLSVVAHNPGVTSRQLCQALGILPPNLVGLVNSLEQRALVRREPHPRDGRALGLHLTPEGIALVREAERTAAALEAEVASRLTAAEQKTLMRLLKKLYQPA